MHVQDILHVYKVQKIPLIEDTVSFAAVTLQSTAIILAPTSASVLQAILPIPPPAPRQIT